MTSPQHVSCLYAGLLLCSAALLCGPALSLHADDNKPSASAQALQDSDELMLAVAQRNPEKVKALLGKGVDIECRRGSFGDTPLMKAASDGAMEIVKLLVSRGANMQPKDAFHGRAPLTQAALYARLDVVKFLVEHGADVNVNCTTEGHSYYLMTEGIGPHNPTPLAEAAVGRDVAVIKYLVQRGAKINGRDGSSYTPLMWACIGGMPKTVQALLRLGADASLQTDQGKTARSMVRRNQSMSERDDLVILAMLDAAGKK